MVVTGKSGTGKTNLLANLVLGDKDEYVQKRKKGGSRYIRCDDLIICGYHSDEPKWAYVRYIYNMISKDPRAPYYEDISFSYILPEKIPSSRAYTKLNWPIFWEWASSKYFMCIYNAKIS